MTVTYGYDGLDRLTSVDYADLDVLYTYDPVSNRETEVETAPDGSVLKNCTFTYSTRDQLTTLTDNLDATQSVT